MRAAVLRGVRQLRIEDVGDPGPPDHDEVTIAVSHAAICGTDAGEWHHGSKLTVPPVILGHEFAGEVVDVGADVDDYMPGDRVVSGAGVSCGDCDWCRAGRTNLCSSYHTLGLDLDGGLAELVNAPASTLIAIPDGLPFERAAVAQPLAVAIHAVKRSGVRQGESCAVVGIGGIGAFITAATAELGVDVIAVDIDEVRLETARRLGAGRSVNAIGRDLAEAIRGSAEDEGPHVVIEASGVAHGPAAALAAVRRGGRVLLVGLQSAPRELDLLSLTLREIELTSTLAHVLADDLSDALELLVSTAVFDEVVEKVIALDDLVEEGLRPLAEGRARGKVIVDVRG
jgi:(R,R)-butanediol dehydrogenase / meso-butanediol dehydrogenase / diacetyl reductase